MDVETSPQTHTQITEQFFKECQDAALEFKKLYEESVSDFQTSMEKIYYIVSLKWLEKWKQNISYEELIHSKQPSKHFGQIQLGCLNEDLIDTTISENDRYQTSSEYANWNIMLRAELQEQRDYVIVDVATWDFIKDQCKDYQPITIQREAYQLPNGMKKVEVYLKQLRTILINNDLLKKIDMKRATELQLKLLQVSHQCTLKDMKNELSVILNRLKYITYNVRGDQIRIWKLDGSHTVQKIFQYMFKKVQDSSSYDYKIEFDGQFLEKDQELTIEELEIVDEDIIIIELREPNKKFIFINEQVEDTEKCEYCSRYDKLKYPCACKKVQYCTEECRIRDKRYHQLRCEKAGDSDDEEIQQEKESRMGLVGLQNLGNTCFMNSGLQCLSHLQSLTKYFLEGKYKNEINIDNPLGTKGRLTKKYSKFLRQMWYDTSRVYSPWSLKQAISQFQPQFSGYNQHDSQELISFLLDGLHEDLNRVKKKPYTEQIEINEHHEKEQLEELAKKAWINHLRRNQSIIVDLMHGQFKSQLTCPQCKRISITFDPFLTCSLPIPSKEENSISFFFIYSSLDHKAYKFEINYNVAKHTIGDLKKDICNRIKNMSPDRIQFANVAYTEIEEVYTDDVKTDEARKKSKTKYLFAIELPQQYEKVSKDNLISIPFQVSKKVKFSEYYQPKKQQTFLRFVYVDKQHQSIGDVKRAIFRYIRSLLVEYRLDNDDEEKQRLQNMSEDELYRKFTEGDDALIDFNIVSNSRGWQPCYFCGDRKCENCQLQGDNNNNNNNENILIEDIMKKVTDEDHQFQLELYWKQTPSWLNLDRFNYYDEWNLRKDMDDGSSDSTNTSNNNNTKQEIKRKSIYDCLGLFEEAEQLSGDNTWYCSGCKEHVKAQKQMKIYKSPQILAIHLKRFKSGQQFGRGKINEVITSPLEDLDLTDYVINPDLPHAYFTSDEAKQIYGIARSEDGINNNNNNVAMQIEENPPSTMLVNKHAPNQRLMYSLFAVSNHYGSVGFGHYTAYAKNPTTNSWYSFDDSSVATENPNNVISDASYVLFYERINQQ